MAEERVGLRQRRHAQAQREIRETAMTLFAERGFADVTVAQVAASAGVSQRTFFRYFQCKEDVVVDAPVGYGAVLAAVLAGRPRQESAWDALVATLRTRVETWQGRRADAADVLTLLDRTPALAGRLSGKTNEWHGALAEVVAERMDGQDPVRALRATAMVGAALACLDGAFREWQRGSDQSLDTLFSIALDTVRPPTVTA